MRRSWTRAARFGAIAAVFAGALVSLGGTTPAGAAPESFVGLVPARLLETRGGLATIDGQFQGDRRGRCCVDDEPAGARSWWCACGRCGCGGVERDGDRADGCELCDGVPDGCVAADCVEPQHGGQPDGVEHGDRAGGRGRSDLVVQPGGPDASGGRCARLVPCGCELRWPHPCSVAGDSPGCRPRDDRRSVPGRSARSVLRRRRTCRCSVVVVCLRSVWVRWR